MKSNDEWLAWGERDPLYGVATWPGRQRDGVNPWTDEEFYALSKDWLDFYAVWKRTVGYHPGIVLEIGSGAGRITRMLAGAFEHVIATDVSPKMLEYAREKIHSPNIDWQVCDGDHIPATDESVDAVFSCHVFQHFPSMAAQLSAFREVHRVLKPGGTFFVHLHVHVFPEMNASVARLVRAAYKTYARCAAARGVVRRALMSLAGKGYMRDISYELPQLFADLDALGFVDVSLSTIRVHGFRSIHPCVLGKKPASHP